MDRKRPASQVYLVADARERCVVPFLETELKEHAYVVQQVTTADYLVCRRQAGGGAAVLAAVERKTLEDFAASFKDGRSENIQKLRALRDRTGCQLYYFVEGPAFPSPARRFARIPYANILAAITKLMVRDGVFVVQTEDQCHTARRLADFLRAFDGEPAPAAGGGAPPDSGAAPVPDILAEQAEQTDGGALPVPDILTEQAEQTDGDAAARMWMRLHGISIVLGQLLTRAFSAADLAAQVVTLDQLKALKTATGRPISKDAFESLAALRAGQADPAVKLLSGLRNITPAVARLILDSAGGLRQLCAAPAAQLAEVSLPQRGRTVRLGKARAARIWRILHHAEAAPAPAPLPAPPADGLDAPAPALTDDDLDALLGL